MLLEKATEIELIAKKHKSIATVIAQNIRQKHNLPDEDSLHLRNINFRSYETKGGLFSPGLCEVKYYWLNYINQVFGYYYQSWEECIRNIIDSVGQPNIIEEFKSFDFYESGEFKLTYLGDNEKGLNLLVPFSLSYFQIEFAINLIEKISKSTINKITFWYFNFDPFDSGLYHAIHIAVDDDPNKHGEHPYISKESFLNLNIRYDDKWYNQIPELKDYVDEIDAEDFANWPDCKKCGDKNDVSDERRHTGRELWYCSHCEHLIDQDGDCVSDECETCTKEDESVDISESTDNEIDFPECKKCGDANDVSDPGGSYWWCSHCEHSIDQDGDCVSDECETCTKEDESVDISESTDNEIDLPECKKCGDANDVNDPGGSYWWCSHCEHSIDQDGDCVSDECETCEKDSFIALNGPFYLFFDTETTGVPRDWKAPLTNFDNWPRIVQLAWLIYDNNGTQILKNEFIIKPSGFEIPIEASNVHGITTEYALEHGTQIEDVLLKFEKHCEKSKYLIAHNINFDSKVTSSEYLRILSRNPISKLEKMCTMESSTNYCKIPGDYGYKWPKLSELHVKLFGVDFEGAHDALADIEATAKCFWEMRKLKLI
jgi:DNA polymerase III epsilon subunit-like protein/ribosomal protein L37AE/L43A